MSKMSNYINSYCTGCGLCHSIMGAKISKDEKGFPNSVLTSDENLKFYESVCPIFNYVHECEHDVWGSVDKALIGYSADKDVRYKAATGGALTELSVYLLEEGLIEGVIHTTTNPEAPTETISCISYTKEEVRCRCGSRYSISVPLYEIMQNIDIDKRYAFIGKPCDVMALRNYISLNPSIKPIFPYLMSFFCAGEPSGNAQIKLLNKMECNIDDCSSITYRGNGWPGYTTIVKKDGSKKKLEYKEAWGQYLGRDLRNVCRFCMDGTGEAADIVCADFWHLDKNQVPEFTEHNGRNIIITRSKLGTNIVNDAIIKSFIICEKDYTKNMDRFYKYQPHQYRRKSTMKSMIKAMKLCGRNIPKYSTSYLNKYANHATQKEKLEAFTGIIKRVMKRKI